MTLTSTGRTPPTPDGGRTVGVGHPRPMPVWRYRHLAPNTLVVAYLGAAVVAAGVPELTPMPRWIALHLLLLGAATNAIFTWGTHFADAMLHSRDVGPRAAVVRLVVLNAGVVAAIAGVAADQPALVAAGTAAVVVGAVMYGGRIARLALRGVTGRLRVTVWYYVAAAVSLVAGAVLGGLMGAHVVHAREVYESLHAAHVHVNLLGWVGLTVLGTEFMMWPAVLRTRMAEATPAVAAWVLVICGAGLVAGVTALAAGAVVAGAAGVAVYAAGVGLSLHPFVVALRGRSSYAAPAAAWALGASTGWFVVGLVIDVAALAAGGGERRLDALVPVLAIGLVAQVLVGAMTFLLPVVLGGGPHGNRRLSALLATWWLPRLVVANVGVLLLVLPAPHPVRTAGLVLALVGLGAFVPLAVVALLARPGGRPRLDVDPLEVLAVAALAAVVMVFVALVTGALPPRHPGSVHGAPHAGVPATDAAATGAVLTPAVRVAS